MEMKLGTITVGKATKHTKVKMDIGKIVKLYKSGMPVAQIAREIGFPPNAGPPGRPCHGFVGMVGRFQKRMEMVFIVAPPATPLQPKQ